MHAQDIDPAFGNWLAGFIDGEGCFSITKHTGTGRYKCRFALALRADDRPILEEIHRRTQLGWLWARKAGYDPSSAARPQVLWNVSSKAECLSLTALLDQFPLRAKKAADFALWREAVLIWARMRPVRRSALGGVLPYDWSAIAFLREKLMANHQFDPVTVPAPEPPPTLWED